MTSDEVAIAIRSMLDESGRRLVVDDDGDIWVTDAKLLSPMKSEPDEARLYMPLWIAVRDCYQSEHE